MICCTSIASLPEARDTNNIQLIVGRESENAITLNYQRETAWTPNC